MSEYNAYQQDIVNQVMMLCGPTYFGQPSHMQIIEVSTYTGTKKHVAIAMLALDILVKANAEPARQQYLQNEIQKGQYSLVQEAKIEKQNNMMLQVNSYQQSPGYSNYLGLLGIGGQGGSGNLPEVALQVPKKLKINKINRYLEAFIREASNGHVITHQMASQFQVRLLCTVCNATFSYDEDAESDWAVSSARDFCHDHRHPMSPQIVEVKLELKLDVPDVPVDTPRRKFRDE